jgi:hypothetical protein
MKKVIIVLMMMVCVSMYAQVTFLSWDFENATLNETLSPTFELGSGATLTNHNTTPPSTGAFPAGVNLTNGNNTGTSFSVSGFPATAGLDQHAGIQILTSTVGLYNISIEWHQLNSNGAPNRQRLQYTIDGNTWIDFDANEHNAMNIRTANPTIAPGFDNGLYTKHLNNWFHRRANLSSIEGVNNNPNFGIRLVGAKPFGQTNYAPTVSGTNFPASTMRFDNITFRHEPNLPVVITPTATPPGGTYFVSQMVTLATETDGATIHYTLDGATPSTASPVYSTPLNISTSTTLMFFAVKIDMADSQVVTAIYDIQTPTIVNSIAELKATATPGNNIIYQIPDGIVLTVGNPPHDNRNQKYVQDLTGTGRQGILIDDPNVSGTNQITTALVPGDELLNLTGRVTLHQGMWQFVPIVDITKGTTGNVVEPLVVTFDDILQNMLRYQSVLVEVHDVTFLSQGNFGSGGVVYDIEDSTASFRFRNHFWQADYVNAQRPIPHIPVKLIGLVSRANITNPTVSEAIFITARSWADLHYNPVNTPNATPAGGTFFEPINVTLSTTTEDAVIRYTTDGSTPTETHGTIYTAPIQITETTELKFIATKDSMDGTRVIVENYRLPVNVNNIAELKSIATPGDGIIYRIANGIVHNHGPLAGAQRNQRYIQDMSGIDREGILVDDPTVSGANIITTVFNRGDEITDLIGSISVFNGMWQLTPLRNPTRGTTGNAIEPLIVTFEEITENILRYQAVLVKVNDVVFRDRGNFTVGNIDYDITDGTAPFMFRTQFHNADYLSATIPFSPINLTGIVSTVTPSLTNVITARTWEDFDVQKAELYLPPRGLTAEVENITDVKLNWSLPLPGGMFSHAVSDEMNSIGINDPGGFYVAQRFTAEQLIAQGVAGQTLTGMQFMVDDSTCEFEIVVWVGGTWHPTIQNLRNPGIQVIRQDYGLCPFAGVWVTVEFENPITIPVDRELWIGYYGETTGGYPAAVDEGPAYHGFGNLIRLANNWTTLLDLNDNADFNWMIRGIATTNGGSNVHFGTGVVEYTPIITPMINRARMSTATSVNIRYNTNSGMIRNAGLLGYDIYRSDNGAAATRIENLVQSRTFTDYNRPVGVFVYHVKAVYESDTDIVTSDPSNTVPITFTAVLNPPHDLYAEIDGEDIVLTWKAPLMHPHLGNLLYYRIFMNDDMIKDNHNKDSLVFTDVSVQKEKDLYYQVVAVYSEGDSDMSEFFKINVPLIIYNPPTNLAGSINADGRIVLTWQPPVAGGEGTFQNTYNIYRYGVEEAVVKDYGSLEWIDVDTTVVAGVLYRYYVTANYLEGESIRSNRAEVLLHVLNPPRYFTTSIVNNHVKLDWQAPASHTHLGNLIGYRIFKNNSAIVPDIASNVFTFIDIHVVVGGRYEYYVIAVYSQGLSVPTQTEIIDKLSDTDIVDGIMVTTLRGNYPNPFNPQTTIKFEIGNGKLENVVINIYNIRGQHIRSLVNGRLSAGQHSVVWNGTDDNGRAVGSGIYFYRMTTDGYSETKKMIMMK